MGDANKGVKLHIDEDQTMKWPKEKGEKDKQ